VDSGCWAPAAGHRRLRRLAEDDEDSEIEIVYSLDPASWGHGYAAEAAEAVLGYAFGVVGLDRVIAEIDEGNTASAALAERLGMRPYETVPGQLGPMTHYVLSSGSRG